jgi:hypothetical protein
MAKSEKINVGLLSDNGDAERFTDFSGNWSKALKHDALGIPNAQSYGSLLHAVSSGRFQDFEDIIVGTPGGTGFTSTLNGRKVARRLNWKDRTRTPLTAFRPRLVLQAHSPRLRRSSIIGPLCCAMYASPTTRRIR